jgi:hypothetical protein
MLSSEFLVEAPKKAVRPAKPKVTKAQQVAAFLKENCGPFLAAIGNETYNYALFRGIGGIMGGGANLPGQMFIPCPKGRSPKDLDRMIHEAADDWFLENTGINYRSDALFATGDANIAADHGVVYAIFPMGDFKFCWSPKISDLYQTAEGELPNSWEDEIELLDAVYDLLGKANYQTTDIKRAINSQHEVMIHGTGAFAIRMEDNPAILNDISTILRGGIPEISV